ncbi:MAG: adenosylcobinamide-GDP ribazoletransferase, partial [Pseudomonadota bacterium]
MTAKHTVSEYLYPLLIALALLTKLPVLQWLPEQWSDKHQGQSLLYYPAVGLILALLLFVIDCLLPDATAPPVAGIIIVTAWVVLTGALHIDGFADSVDAACAAHRHTGSAHTPTILAVLKDPAAGPMALAATVLLICSKILLMAQMQAFILLALITCLVMARTLALVFMITTPYVNPNGLAANVVKH